MESSQFINWLVALFASSLLSILSSLFDRHSISLFITLMQFDPVLIAYQIVALQCFYYLAMGTMLGIFHAMFDIKVSMDHVFTPKFINFVSTVGWIETICTLATGLAGAYLLSIIVEKSKKCVDFTFTLYFIHIILCVLYYQEFPLEWQWWLVNVVTSVMMASMGEYICSRHELEDIPLYKRDRDSSTSSSSSSGNLEMGIK